MLDELAGPEPIFGAPDPPVVTGGTGGAGLDATARGVASDRARFFNGCGFTDAAGACTVTGGSACGFAVLFSAGDWARA
jgi:hypothetical protein